MSALVKVLSLIVNVFDHPTFGPIARKVAYQATKEILRAAYKRRPPIKSNSRVG